MSKDLNKATAEQAGGDERDFQAKGAQEVPSPVSKEYDRHLISLLRKGEALPGHQEEAADEIERLRDWNDHLNNTVLPNILNPNFLMLMKGGERLLDLCTKDGEFIGVSLNDMKDVFDWMVTHARIAPDQAALAQPSPAQAEQAEVVAWRYGFSGGIVSDKACLDEWKSGGEYQSLMTVAQHERIVGALRAVITQLHQHKNDYMDAGQETYRALQNEIREREAEIARLDGLVSVRTAERDAALARVEQQERTIAGMNEAHAKLADLYEAAQTQHSVPVAREQLERLVRILDAHNYAKDAEALMALLAAAPAQAQHSVPAYVSYTTRPAESLAGIALRQLKDESRWVEIRDINAHAFPDMQSHSYYPAGTVIKLPSPSNPIPQAWLDVQAERRRQVEAEGWTPEHDDEHNGGELADAAACYALWAGGINPGNWREFWPWAPEWLKHSEPRRMLVKAAALILAEIQRLDRAAAAGKEVGHE
ncbi:LysM peptidoglycan-binding domain-containing protein [Pseudomonas aeruginosa]|uniref:LysM peptidoglycan-binding domain-containing protein n=1 Tax=Pseudomonas aeruginosa TaxID=287 RepID=UPI000B319DFC|nr:hypothetical protein [Pseudomonas aeruginosa]